MPAHQPVTSVSQKPMNIAMAEEEDFFDRLPDALLLLIFNKLGDAKSLTRCLSVSKRFASLVCETDAIFLSVPPRKNPNPKPKWRSPLKLFKLFVSKFVAKPLHLSYHCSASKSSAADSCSGVSYYLPNEVLKHFKEVKSMHIELPSDDGDFGIEGGGDSLLKWKAVFGSTLRSCVLVGAESLQRTSKLGLSESESFFEGQDCHNQGDHDVGEAITEDELKVRVAWTVSCLIAASARHCLLKKILTEHHSVEDVIISDVHKQGKLCMAKEQVFEMRNSLKTSSEMSESSPLERTKVPDMNIKLWYVPALELPRTGFLMKGATLVVIRPVDNQMSSGMALSSGHLPGFDGEDYEQKVCDEAVKAMVKMRNNYILTMNSF